MPATSATSVHNALHALAEEFWQGFLAAEPTFATVLGDHRFDDRLPDISPAGRAAHRAFLAGIGDRARAIDGSALDPTDRTTRSVLIEEVDGQLAMADAWLDRWTVDPIGGPPTAFMDLPEFQPTDTPDRAAAMVARWRAIGRLLEQHIANLRDGLADGQVAVRAPVERVLEILAGLEARPLEEWSLVAPGGVPHPDWAPAAREAFAADLESSVRDVVGPAFAAYRTFLESEILPAARGQDRPGMMHVPGGVEAYRRLIRVHTTLDVSPEEIHAVGLAEMERIDREFAELGRRVLGTEDRGATLARLRDDPALRFATADEVRGTAERSLARAQAAIGDWFGVLPRALCEVVPVPTHAQEHQTIAYYTWPSLDGSRPGRFWINLHAPETRPRYDAEALAFHEAVPGHHLQIAIAQELEGLPAFQRNLGPTAFAEGWGLYTERLCDEMGLYSSDLDRFGILSFDAWRAGRLVVDTGMHALGWSRAEAIAYLHEHTALGDNNIANEVDRYIVWPGQALAYKIGQLEFLRLRARARSVLGDRFDIRAFHDVALGSGAVPLGTLAELVEDWLQTA